MTRPHTFTCRSVGTLASTLVWLSGIGAGVSLVVWLVVFFLDRYFHGNFDSLVGIGETPSERKLSDARRREAGDPDPVPRGKRRRLPGWPILLVTVILIVIAVASATMSGDRPSSVSLPVEAPISD